MCTCLICMTNTGLICTINTQLIMNAGMATLRCETGDVAGGEDLLHIATAVDSFHVVRPRPGAFGAVCS